MMLSRFAAYRVYGYEQERDRSQRYKATLILRLPKLIEME